MILIIRQPINVYPSLGNAVDGSLSTNKFSFTFSGDKLYSYQILIYDAVTNATVYTGSVIPMELYNGQLFEHTMSATAFTNGRDLIWKARLRQANADMKIVSSTCQTGSSTTSIRIRPNSAIKAGMNMVIGAETKAISAFVNYLSISNSTLGSGSTYDVIKIASGLTATNVVQYTLMIGTQKRTIIAYDTATGNATVSPSFTNLYASGTAYIVADERVAVATTSAFTPAPALGTQYTAYSAFVDTPNYFFKARTLPALSVATDSPLASRKYAFVGTYSQAQGTGIKYHIFNLYDESNILLDTTGQIYNGLLEYTYDAFVSGFEYFIELIVVNQENVEITTVPEAFSVSYGTLALDKKPTLTNLEDSNAIQITWEYATGLTSPLVGYVVYRQKVGEAKIGKIAEVNTDMNSIIDYNVANQTEYIYIVYLSTESELGISMTSDPITSCWWGWSATELLKISDNTYTTRDIFLFNANLQSGDNVQNLDQTIFSTYSKYPKSSVGSSNFKTLGFSALLNRVNQTTHIYSDTIPLKNSWDDFVARGNHALLKDPKGNVYYGIFQNPTARVSDMVGSQPVTINISFTELGSTNDITVYKEADWV